MMELVSGSLAPCNRLLNRGLNHQSRTLSVTQECIYHDAVLKLDGMIYKTNICIELTWVELGNLNYLRRSRSVNL